MQGADRQEGYEQVITAPCLQQDIGFGGQALGVGAGEVAFRCSLAVQGEQRQAERDQQEQRQAPGQHPQPVGGALLQRQFLVLPRLLFLPLLPFLGQAGRQIHLPTNWQASWAP